MIADIKKRALHRARVLEGQLRGVENHLRAHVAEMFDEGGTRRDDAVDELLTVFELQNNRGS